VLHDLGGMVIECKIAIRLAELRMTFARDKRRGGGTLGRFHFDRDLRFSPAPVINAANDNEQCPRFVAIVETSDLVASVQPTSRGSLGTATLAVVCVATASIIAAGWILVVSMTLLDSIKWFLS
jgi:hypothetical protein